MTTKDKLLAEIDRLYAFAIKSELLEDASSPKQQVEYLHYINGYIEALTTTRRLIVADRERRIKTHKEDDRPD